MEKASGVHYIGGRVGGRATLYAVDKSTISAPAWNPAPITGHPACSLDAVVTGLTHVGKKLTSQATLKLTTHDHKYLKSQTYLIHGDNKWQLGLVENGASIQHVRHKCDGIRAAYGVHHVHHDCGEC